MTTGSFHCGHERTDINTYRNREGYEYCRVCKNARQQTYLRKARKPKGGGRHQAATGPKDKRVFDEGLRFAALLGAMKGLRP